MLGQRYLKLERIVGLGAIHAQFQHIARLVVGNRIRHGFWAIDGLTVHCRDDVTPLQPGSFGRAIVCHAHHGRSSFEILGEGKPEVFIGGTHSRL
jgi:hypothetical protein